MVKGSSRTPTALVPSLASIDALLVQIENNTDGIEGTLAVMDARILVIEVLLGAGLPLALVVDSLKVREQVPLTQIIAEGSAGDPIFNIESVVSGALSSIGVGAGNQILTSPNVPAGKIWIITNFHAYNNTTINPRHDMRYRIGGVTHEAKRTANPPVNIGSDWQGHLYLSSGSAVVCRFTGCVAGDNIYFSYNGYQMDA